MNDSYKIEQNKKLIMQYGLVMTEGMTEDTIRQYTKNEEYIKGVMKFRTAFPDYTIFMEDLTAEGDFVILHGKVSGTHKGDGLGVAPTFKKIEFPMMVKYQIEDNMIINAWPMFDQMALFEQLGVINRPQ